MPNHLHLLLRPGSVEALPGFMRRLMPTRQPPLAGVHGRRGQGTLQQGRCRSARMRRGGAQLLTVLRHNRAQPQVRARLVASAIDWPRSNRRERLSGRAGKLAALPVPLPAGWLAHVDAPQTAAEVVAVRRAVSGGSGRPAEPRAGRGSGYRPLIAPGTKDRAEDALGSAGAGGDAACSVEYDQWVRRGWAFRR